MNEVEMPIGAMCEWQMFYDGPRCGKPASQQSGLWGPAVAHWVCAEHKKLERPSSPRPWDK